jgi:hypothetical protein
MKIPHMRLFLGFLAIAAAMIACSMPSGPERPPTPVPLTTEEIQQFEGDLQATLANPAPSGEVTVTITEQQLHSYLIAKLAEDPNLPITNPQVALADGQVEVYGNVNQSGVTANLQVVLKPRIDENGSPKLDVTSINLGPFPVPDTLKERVQAMADDALADSLASAEGRFQVTNVVVTDEAVTITGVPQQ